MRGKKSRELAQDKFIISDTLENQMGSRSILTAL